MEPTIPVSEPPLVTYAKKTDNINPQKNKRRVIAALIILLVLVTGLLVGVYLVKQRQEIRKQAAGNPYQIIFNNKLPAQLDSHCEGGATIEIEQTGLSYDPLTRKQTFKFRAKRINSGAIPLTPYPTVTPHVVECASVKDCNKADVCWEAASCSEQQCVYVKRVDGFTCVGGKCLDGKCVASTPIPTKIPTLINTPIPTVTPTPTYIPPTPTVTISQQVLGLTTINSKIEVLALAYACSNNALGQCSNCGPEDAPYYARQEQWLTILPGENYSNEFEISVNRYGDGSCGCLQMDFYITQRRIDNGPIINCGKTNTNYVSATGSGPVCSAVISTPTPSTPLRPSPTPTPTSARAPTPTGTIRPTPTGTLTPSPTGSTVPTPTGTLTPSPTATTTPTPISTSGPTPTGTIQPTATPKATNTPKPTTVAQVLTPTTMELPKSGVNIPTLGTILGGFLLISIGAAFIF